jgi:NDP-sugar pyrophosphorylase family protein
VSKQVDAIVLVGGKGTRLRPLTLSAPKPMLPTAGLPFLAHLLSRIAAAGIEHVILGTSYRPAVFEAEFGDGSKLGLQIEYVTEQSPLGTGGGIANVAGRLRHDTALVFNGDVLSGADLGQLLDYHHEQQADLTLHLVRVSDPRAFGCVPTEDGRVTAFLEKTEDPPTDQINAGCYVFSRETIDRIPRGREVSVEREVFPALLSDGVKVCGYVDASYWRDMGTPEDFVRGSADLVRGITGAGWPSRRAVGARRRRGVARRAAHRRHRRRTWRGDRPRRPVGRCGHLRRRADRGRQRGRTLDHRVRCADRSAGADPRRRDRRRRRHRRPLRAAAWSAGLARRTHSRRRDPLLQRRLSALD